MMEDEDNSVSGLTSLDARLANAQDFDSQLQICGVRRYHPVEMYEGIVVRREQNPNFCPYSGNLVYDSSFSE